MCEIDMNGFAAIYFKEPVTIYVEKKKLNNQVKEEYLPKTAKLITNDNNMPVYMTEAYDSTDNNIVIKLETPIGEKIVITPNSNIVNVLEYEKWLLLYWVFYLLSLVWL